MNHVLAIARKELRGYFQSAVAIIFLAAFLGVVVFTFFWVDKFFSRGIADVRPLFDWLPLLLIFLVAALSMRLWSEEQKVGTIEILLTLPVPHWKLVMGKFLAGMALIGLALLLTLGLPITVSMMGPLDWGPVIGGYLAALLLAAAYLSIGLCVSAATDNQIVALILTTLIGALLYLPGVDDVVRFFGGDTGELLRRISTKGRFESIARGVLDIRDLAYYGSLIVLGLTVNTLLLHAKSWSQGARTRTRRFNQQLLVGLVAGNVIALNLWMAPVSAARVDLTEHNEYSLSPVTETLLGSLDQPLTIRGYFSEKTHPLLAPIIPQIRDLLAEYEVAGKNVKLEFVDPADSEQVEKEAQEKYGIKSFPFRFADRREKSVVNAYFHILVEYGDQHEVLTFEDLLEVRQTDIGDLEVQLRNFEYDVTRTIKKVAYGFQSLESLFASLGSKAQLTLYVTPKSLPEQLSSVPATVERIAKDLAERSGDMLSFEQVDPSDPAMQKMLADTYGFKPFPVSLLSNQGFYLHMVLKVGNRELPILPPREVTDAAIEEVIIEGVKRAAPGFIKKVAIWTPPAPPPPPQQMPGQPPPRSQPPQTFRTLSEQLGGSYETRPADLSKGHVDDDIDVLILAGPANLDEQAQQAVDQFVMRGGSLIVLAGRYRLDPQARELVAQKLDTGLEPLFDSWGIEIQPKLVLDSRNDSFPIPVERDLGGLVVRDIQELPYPYFLRVPRDAMGGGIITGQLATAVVHFASPLLVEAGRDEDTSKDEDKDKDGLQVDTLLRSSGDAWLSVNPRIQPDFRLHPGTGFGKPQTIPEGEDGPHVLAVAITGSFDSAFAKKAAENDANGDDGQTSSDSKDSESAERLIESSPPGTRLVVVGSSSFVSDELLALSQQSGSDYVVNNIELVQNMVDWAVADTDLLAIRSRGTHTRLIELPADQRGKWEWINYGLMALGLAAIFGVSVLRQRSQMPMQLSPRRTAGVADKGDER